MGQEQLLVRMNYGTHVNFPLKLIRDQGKNVTVRDAIIQASIFGVPLDAAVTVNGSEGDLDTVLQNADSLTFCKEVGEKAWKR